MKNLFFVFALILIIPDANAQTSSIKALIDQRANDLEDQVIEWRRYFYENPELSNQEFNAAESNGAEAILDIREGYPITYNDPDLTTQMLPTLQEVAGSENVNYINAITGAEDFSFFQEEVPGLYFFLGGLPDGGTAAGHHTPDFYIDESGMKLGVRALANLVIDYFEQSTGN